MSAVSFSVKSPLIKTGLYPAQKALTHEEAFLTFWALNEHWWMQIFDGRVHIFGPMVFDEGLHNGPKEPGYFASAKAACEWISIPANLMKKPDIGMYKALHKVACRHFDGKSTEIDARKIGMFSSPSATTCKIHKTQLQGILPDDMVGLENDFKRFERYKIAKEEAIKAHGLKEPFTRKDFEEKIFPLFKALYSSVYSETATVDEFISDYEKALAWLKIIEDRAQARMKQINAEIAKRCSAIGLSKAIAIYKDSGSFGLVEYQASQHEAEYVTELLFWEYEKNMEQARSKEEKLRHIAELFQMLEWLHPFADGQGRTDLILLNKELVRNGFTPAILDQPYVSTFYTLDEWVLYLKKGMEKWEIQRRQSMQKEKGDLKNIKDKV